MFEKDVVIVVNECWFVVDCLEVTLKVFEKGVMAIVSLLIVSRLR